MPFRTCRQTGAAYKSPVSHLPASDDTMADDMDVEMEVDEPAPNSLNAEVPRAPSVFFSGAPISPDLGDNKFTTIGFGAANDTKPAESNMKQTKLSDYFAKK